MTNNSPKQFIAYQSPALKEMAERIAIKEVRDALPPAVLEFVGHAAAAAGNKKEQMAETIPEPDEKQVGEIFPQGVIVGTHGSKFMGALATAGVTVLHMSSAKRVFEQLSIASLTMPPAVTDGPKNLDGTLRQVRDFKLPFPFVERLAFSPLVSAAEAVAGDNQQASKPIQSSPAAKISPYARTVDALEQGAAVILPLQFSIDRPEEKAREGDDNSGKIGRKRLREVTWAVVTGYQDEIVVPESEEADQAPTPDSPPEVDRFFAVSVPGRRTRMLHHMSAEELERQLGNASYARTVSAVEIYHSGLPGRL